VTDQVEPQLELGNKTAYMSLLILPRVIDDLVLGWDFLSNMGTKFECAGIEVRIPTRRQNNKGREERLTVINTKHVQE